MLDHIFLTKIARNYQIDEYSILREYLQIRFLDTFYGEGNIKVYFKGGTALRLIFGSSRFSEDLDFTACEDLASVKQHLSVITRKLRTEFPNLYFKEVEAVEGFAEKIYLPTDISPMPLTIKLDFSLREDVLDPMASPIQTELPVMPISMVSHLSIQEVLAEKIRAIMNREKGRDIFDLWFLLSKNVPLNSKLVQAKLDYYHEQFLMNELKKRIEKTDVNKMDLDLRKFLPVSQRKIALELKRLILEKLVMVE